MFHCRCERVRRSSPSDRLVLECLDCVGGRVCCPCCGEPTGWPPGERRLALQAAEAHRWETGHARVVVRDAQHHILREVAGDLAGA